MGQTRSLPFAQGFNLPFGHRALQVRGNSAAVDSFAGSDQGGKYGDVGVVTQILSPRPLILKVFFFPFCALGVSFKPSLVQIWCKFSRISTDC